MGPRFYSILLFASLLLPSLNAVSSPPPSAIDPGFLPQSCVFSAAFAQKQTMVDIPEPLESSGRLFFNCEAGLIWQQHSPSKETYVYTRNHQVFHQRGEAPLSPQKGKLESHLAKLLTGLMGGDTRYLKRYFQVTQQSDTQLVLTPKRKRIGKFVSQLTLSKHAAAKEISWGNALGNTTTLSVFDIHSYPQYEQQFCLQWLAQSEQSCQHLNKAP